MYRQTQIVIIPKVVQLPHSQMTDQAIASKDALQIIIRPRCDETCPQGFQQGHAQAICSATETS